MNNSKLNVSVKSFITSIITLLVLMILTYILTLFIPSGSYSRIIDPNTNKEIIDFASGYQTCENNFKFIQFIFSPILVLTSSDATTIIAIIAFLLIIGGIINSLNEAKITDYMINKIANKFKDKKYLILFILTLFFMLLGSSVGTFEEIIALLPLILVLITSLGFDVYTAIGCSLVACCFGFASGIINPFTVGIAQRLAGLASFSGIGFRIICFIIIYVILSLFIYLHAKKVDTKESIDNSEFENNKIYDKAAIAFTISLTFAIVLIILSTIVTFLQDYTTIILGLSFLIGGIISCIIVKMKASTFFKSFGKGVLSYLPSIIMILMASSIKYILVESNCLDTILYSIVNTFDGLNKFEIILLIYLLVLVMNFFIPSGSAKAFLLIPLISPLAIQFNISMQLCILAFIFGDGFSNVIYPTNPVLLLSLSESKLSYGKYIKHFGLLQLILLVVTCLLLGLGLLIRY